MNKRVEHAATEANPNFDDIWETIQQYEADGFEVCGMASPMSNSITGPGPANVVIVFKRTVRDE